MSRHRLALLTWVVVWPLITALLLALEPLVADLPLPVRTLILSGLMVSIMSYAAMPLALRALRDLLTSSREN
jgi:antibiotic biosynthesis monooxygenase (ABM) superfamily enzyme